MVRELYTTRVKGQGEQGWQGEDISSGVITLGKPLQRRLEINCRRNQQQDHTQLLDQAGQAFNYGDCSDSYWNPEEFSLFYGTPLWDQASEYQRTVLNQLYWVAYYSQIISAEIATIFFNQTSAAALYAHEGFRSICDMLDLESSQERAHISAFRAVAEQTEQALLGKRLFSYPMRGPFTETMIFADTNQLKRWWKQLQLQAFGLMSSSNSFLACQYFTVRGLRTLNGKLVQHQLSRYYQQYDDPEHAPIPSKISFYHFMDESFHFNSSTLLSHEVMRCLPPPTKFETWVANLGIRGCQQDHRQFSVAVNGIFWHDPALYLKVYELLRSHIFAMDDREAQAMMQDCFTQESAGLHHSYRTHQEAMASYRVYLEPLDYVWPGNRAMAIMERASIEGYVQTQKKALTRFFHGLNGLNMEVGTSDYDNPI
ncbi:P-aminobenzoate N-oxygenase AurF [Leptothoe sp. PORK10 BA2]|uniref:P-aminobenzoate N-oxygenase AurF n=1 Tax=Leptothoe sp. PORK10 BA2 TaxID=3110254 RepID=UPI002B220722|nr:P-aminobenzoate N-oxygenase AurF [Leptothoe sp. PORK10 BA2]MEA5463643.1 P-aminobenzoate N-oxygenase AurF [Leptothoe sp. PORK10 BA2]